MASVISSVASVNSSVASVDSSGASVDSSVASVISSVASVISSVQDFKPGTNILRLAYNVNKTMLCSLFDKKEILSRVTGNSCVGWREW